MIVYRAEGAALDSSFVGWGETHQSLLSSLSAGSPPKQPEGQNTKRLRNYSFNYFCASLEDNTLLKELKKHKEKEPKAKMIQLVILEVSGDTTQPSVFKIY